MGENQAEFILFLEGQEIYVITQLCLLICNNARIIRLLE